MERLMDGKKVEDKACREGRQPKNKAIRALESEVLREGLRAQEPPQQT